MVEVVRTNISESFLPILAKIVAPLNNLVQNDAYRFKLRFVLWTKPQNPVKIDQ